MTLMVVSLNTALDRTVRLSHLHVGEVHVAEQEVVVAGGKGFNVLRVALALGLRARFVALAGGQTGAQIRRLARTEGFRGTWLATAGESRTCTILADDEGNATVVNGRGPAVSRAEWEPALDILKQRARRREVAVFCGSVPPGVPADVYALWIHALRLAGVRATVVDASGAVLQAAVQAKPSVLKVNGTEFRAVTREGESPVAAARRLVKGGIGPVVVTMGRDGAFAVNAEGLWYAPALDVRTVNATGSGDAFLAGFLYGWGANGSVAQGLAWGTAAAALNTAQLAPGIPDQATVAQAAARVAISAGPGPNADRLPAFLHTG